MTTYSESVDLAAAPVANGPAPATPGYSSDVILAMVSHIAPGFWCEATAPNRLDLGQRDNHLPDHGAKLEAAAAVLRRYGVRVRRVRWDGQLRVLTVYGPR